MIKIFRGVRVLMHLVIVVSILFNSCQNADSDSERPNVLLILTDQLASGISSHEGNRYINTPAMDRLAASGVVFTRAYVTQPLCLPSRSSLQTGRYTHEIGTINNGEPIKGDFPLLGKLVADAGYACKYIGKWHVGIAPDLAGYSDFDNVGIDHLKTDAAVDYILGEHSEPFFLTVSYMNPHNVCELARDQKLPDGNIGIPPYSLDELPPLPENFGFPDNEPSVIREIHNKSIIHYPTHDWDERKWRQYLWGYNRLVEKVDGEIGKVLDALCTAGLEDNTIIIFTSDHGEGIAMHHWNQKQILYDQATRVPLIIYWKGNTSKQSYDGLVSNSIDITSTILDLVGAQIPETLRGVSLSPLVSGRMPVKRDRIFSETMFAYGAKPLGAKGRMVRSERFKYCIYDNGERREQLFDMKNDPGEMNNLVGQEKYYDILNNHRKLIKEWADETVDTEFPYYE